MVDEALQAVDRLLLPDGAVLRHPDGGDRESCDSDRADGCEDGHDHTGQGLDQLLDELHGSPLVVSIIAGVFYTTRKKRKRCEHSLLWRGSS